MLQIQKLSRQCKLTKSAFKPCMYLKKLQMFVSLLMLLSLVFACGEVDKSEQEVRQKIV